MILVRTDAVMISPEELRRRFRRDVRDGLLSHPRRIPSTYLYDKRGSELFERLAALDSYYLARAEMEILSRRAADIAAFLGPDCLVIEPGAGNTRKAALLLRSLRDPAGYIAIDISCESLEKAGDDLRRELPGLEVRTVCADFTEISGLGTIAARGARRAVFFPGSTIGNFDPPDAADLLARFGGWTGEPDPNVRGRRAGGRMILGVDLEKDPAAVDAAYNDASGATAAFNLNLLERLRTELGAEVDPAKFEHRAFYNAEHCRAEMHLAAREDLALRLDDLTVTFRKGETIRTLSSYKYRLIDVCRLATTAGWKCDYVWTDERAWFAVLGLSWEGPTRPARAR